MPRVRECCKHQHKLWNILKKKKSLKWVSQLKNKNAAFHQKQMKGNLLNEKNNKNLELLLVTCHQMTEV